MLQARYFPYTLDFNFTAITSRMAMKHKDTYFVVIYDTKKPGIYGVGECALFKGLSFEDNEDYERVLEHVCRYINDFDRLKIDPAVGSSILFGVETALNDLHNGGYRVIFPSNFETGKEQIPINGLVWMGDFDTMLQRIDNKIAQGFKCIKIKIGGIDFDRELDLLRHIREQYSQDKLTIRLDANGSMTRDNALHKLDKLARYDIHSIEQPILTSDWYATRYVIKNSPIPVALDEELIGKRGYDHRCWTLDLLPRYIVLKPSLHGGFEECDGWIKDATEREIGWWATSALESNIGLNAIAQWTSTKGVTMPQGLGTGALYLNNISSPLTVNNGHIYYDNNKSWNLSAITDE